MVVVLLGQMVLSAGAFVNAFWVMIIGRVIMGLGNGLTTTLVFSYETILFKEDVSFAMAIGFTFSRLGATLAISFSQTIYDWLALFVTVQNYRLGLVLSVGNMCMIGTVLCVITLISLDRKRERCVQKGRKVQKKNTPVNIQDFKDFSLNYWLVFLSLSLFYGAVFSFVSNGQLLFVSKFGLTVNEASVANSLIYLGTIFVNPIVGKLVSIYGFHIQWCIAGIMLKVLYLLILYSATDVLNFIPYAIGFINAVGYSCFAVAIWPIVPRIVKEHQLNTAYGILNCSWIGPIVSMSAGAIIDHIGYLMQGIYYLTLFCVSCISLLALLSRMG